jgi:hypothetical protein
LGQDHIVKSPPHLIRRQQNDLPNVYELVQYDDFAQKADFVRLKKQVTSNLLQESHHLALHLVLESVLSLPHFPTLPVFQRFHPHHQHL